MSKSDSEPPHRSLPGISLVVPVRNEEMSIGELIASISRQTRQPDEVILVDGGSTDQIVFLVEGLTAHGPRYRVCGGETRPHERSRSIVALTMGPMASADGMEKKHTARLLSIDALRGLAALGVLIFHAVGEYGHGRTAYSGFDLATGVSSQAMLRLIGKCAIFIASFGWVGVILFFVISGFCIHMRWARERALGKKPDIRFVPFWKRRFIRLYPPFFVAARDLCRIPMAPRDMEPDPLPFL